MGHNRYYYDKICKDIAPETCPIIDGIIHSLERVMNGDEDEYQKVLNQLEVVRGHNRALREYALEKTIEADEFEGQKDKFEKELDDAQSELRSKDKEIDELGDQIYRLKEELEEAKACNS